MQLLIFSSFIILLLIAVFVCHFMRTKMNGDLYVTIVTLLFVISSLSGNLGYKLVYRISGIGEIDLYYSSSLYILIFFCILLVYITEGVKPAQKLITAWIGAQFAMAAIQIVFGVLAAPQLEILGKTAQHNAALTVFSPSYNRMAFSIIAALTSLFSSIMLFQFILNKAPRLPLYISLFLSLSVAFILDSLIFVGATRYETFLVTFRSHLMFKIGFSALIGIPFTAYINWFKKKAHVDLVRGSLDIFRKIEHLEDDLSKANKELREYADTLELKVAARTEELEKVNKTLSSTNRDLETARAIAQKDMDIASNLQASFLPKSVPAESGWDIAHTFKPMSGVAGDFYDFYTRGDRLRGVSLFDVSGHGIGSGLLTLIAKSIIFKEFTENDNLPLTSIVEKANEALIAEIGHSGHYLTGTIIRTADSQIEYVNAGHPDILLKRNRTGNSIVITGKNNEWKGMFLGIEAMKTEFKSLRFNVEPGDVLVVFSDCLIESKNQAGEDFSIERINKTLLNVSTADSSKAILSSLHQAFFSFTGTSSLDDDLTIIVMKYLG